MIFLFIIKHLHSPVDNSVDSFWADYKIAIHTDGIFYFSQLMFHLCICVRPQPSQKPLKDFQSSSVRKYVFLLFAASERFLISFNNTCQTIYYLSRNDTVGLCIRHVMTFKSYQCMIYAELNRISYVFKQF